MSRNLKRVGYLGIMLTGVDAVSNMQKLARLAMMLNVVSRSIPKRVKQRVVLLEVFSVVVPRHGQHVL